MNIEEMSPGEIVDEIIEKIEHIFGEAGFQGTSNEYAWLLEKYGVTEEDDNSWIDIIDEDGANELDPNDEIDAQVLAFLDDPEAVWSFLERLLTKYRSNTAVFSEPTA